MIKRKFIVVISLLLILLVSHTTLLAQDDVEDLVEEGMELIEDEEYEDAIDVFNEAIELDDEYAPAHLGLGIALYFNGDGEGGIEEVNRALELDPEYPEALAHLANMIRFVEQDYDRALDLANQAIELDPDLAIAYYYRGRVYLDAEEYEDAIEDFTQAIELDPEYALAYYNRGISYWWLEDYVPALANLLQAVQLDPEDDVFFDDTAYLLEQHFMLNVWDMPVGWELLEVPADRDVDLPRGADFAHPFYGCGDIFINGIVGGVVEMGADFGNDASGLLSSALTIHRSPEEALEAYTTIQEFLNRCPNPLEGLTLSERNTNITIGSQSTTYDARVPLNNFVASMFGFTLTAQGGLTVWVEENFVGVTLYAETGTFRFTDDIIDTSIQFTQANYAKLVNALSAGSDN